MAINNYLETDVRRKKQDERVFREKLDDAFFSRFFTFENPSSADASQVIQQQSGGVFKSKDGLPVKLIRDLNVGQGDRLEFPFVKALSGKGIKGSQNISLEGNEEVITSFKDYIELEEYAHACKDTSPLGRKRALFDISEEMRVQMAGWGVRAIDDLCFNAIEQSSNVYYPGSHTKDSDITSSDKITFKDLKKAKIQAMTRSNGSRYLMEPVKGPNGREYYIAVMNPDSFYDLKEDADFKEAILNSYDRGGFYDHPLFAGADVITADGICIYVSERAGTVSNFGSSGNVAGSKITLMGANALNVAIGGVPGIVPEIKDYRRARGFSFQMFAGFKVPQFDGVDYGSIQIRFSQSRAIGGLKWQLSKST